MERAAAQHWGPFGMMLGTTRPVSFELFGSPHRELADGVRFDVRCTSSGSVSFGWPADLVKQMRSSQGMCPAYPALRGAPPLHESVNGLLRECGVSVRSGVSSGRLLMTVGAMHTHLLGRDYQGLDRIASTPTLGRELASRSPQLATDGVPAPHEMR